MDRQDTDLTVTALARRVYALYTEATPIPVRWENQSAKTRAYWEMQVSSAPDRALLIAEIEREEQHGAVVKYRTAGQVRRCHTFQHHGEYNNATHSWHAVTLLLLLYPGTPSMNLVQAVLYHDLGESELGDMPAPAKYHNPELHRVYAETEQLVLERYYRMGAAALAALTDDEMAWLKGVDRLELMMWCADQMALGNKFAEVVQLRVFEYLQENPPPQQIADYVHRARVRSSDANVMIAATRVQESES